MITTEVVLVFNSAWFPNDKPKTKLTNSLARTIFISEDGEYVSVWEPSLLVEGYVPHGNAPLWDVSVDRTSRKMLIMVGWEWLGCLDEAEPSRPIRFFSPSRK